MIVDGTPIWTVSIKDREDAEMDIWTASFSTEKKAEDFKAKAEEKLKGYGVEVFAMHCDQNSESEIVNFVNCAFKEYDYIDTFVACAGKAEPTEMLIDKTTELVDDILSSNLRGTILFNREILKRFIGQKHGSVVNVSSIYGLSGGRSGICFFGKSGSFINEPECRNGNC